MALQKECSVQLPTRVAHDLRGALQFITGYADLLISERAGPLNPVQMQYLALIRTSTGRILEIVDQRQAEPDPIDSLRV